MASITKKSVKIRAGKFFTLLAFFAATIGVADAQTNVRIQPPVTPKPAATPVPQSRPIRITTGRINNDSGIPAEKSLAVDAKVNVQLCIGNGDVKINGWDRNEVRAMVEEGSFVGFKVLNKNAQDAPAVIKIVGYDTQKTVVGVVNDCLRGDKIEIDVPRGTSVRLEAKQGQARAEIASVYKADVRSNSGDIILNEIAQGIIAQTYQGDINVENSGGAINLSTTNGNIFAYNMKPIEFSNLFSAKTNSGSISLQALEYPQVGVKSVSGAVNYSGKILSGGQYSFDSQNGSIQLNIPRKSSFAVTATYGSGDFKSEIPLANVVKAPGPPEKLSGQTGTGDAALTLFTFVGSINIKTDDPQK